MTNVQKGENSVIWPAGAFSLVLRCLNHRTPGQSRRGHVQTKVHDLGLCKKVDDCQRSPSTCPVQQQWTFSSQDARDSNEPTPIESSDGLFRSEWVWSIDLSISADAAHAKNYQESIDLQTWEFILLGRLVKKTTLFKQPYSASC